MRGVSGIRYHLHNVSYEKKHVPVECRGESPQSCKDGQPGREREVDRAAGTSGAVGTLVKVKMALSLAVISHSRKDWRSAGQTKTVEEGREMKTCLLVMREG